MDTHSLTTQSTDTGSASQWSQADLAPEGLVRTDKALVVLVQVKVAPQALVSGKLSSAAPGHVLL